MRKERSTSADDDLLGRDLSLWGQTRVLFLFRLFFGILNGGVEELVRVGLGVGNGSNVGKLKD